jgi:hypothetical protein
MRRIVAILFVSSFACGGSSSSPDASSHDAPRDVGADAATMQWTGMVIDEHTNLAIAGAQVCIQDHPEIACGSADDNGDWALAFPDPTATENIAISFTAPGYLGELFLEQELVGASSYVSLAVLEDSGFAGTYYGSDAGFVFPDATHGYLAVRVGDNGSGAIATISPAGGTIVYADGSDVPNPALTATSSLGLILIGGVTPGTVEVTVTEGGSACNALSHGAPIVGDWAPSGSATLSAQVVAGMLTTGMTAFCE